MDVGKIVERIPKPENRYNAQFQYEFWNAFEEGSNARAKLLAEQGYRPVPSEDEFKLKFCELVLMSSIEGNFADRTAQAILDLHRWLLEGDSDEVVKD